MGNHWIRLKIIFNKWTQILNFEIPVVWPVVSSYEIEISVTGIPHKWMTFCIVCVCGRVVMGSVQDSIVVSLPISSREEREPRDEAIVNQSSIGKQLWTMFAQACSSSMIKYLESQLNQWPLWVPRIVLYMWIFQELPHFKGPAYNSPMHPIDLRVAWWHRLSQVGMVHI